MGGPAVAKEALDRGSASPGSDPSSVGWIREGLVSVQAPPSDSVFYNPAQVFNRDLSLLVLKAFGVKQQQLIKHRCEQNTLSKSSPNQSAS